MKQKIAFFALLLAACSDPGPAQGQFSVVIRDPTVFKSIRVFRLYVFKTTSTLEATVTCDEFPSVYHAESKELQTIAKFQIDWTGTTDTPKFAKFTVPSDEKLILVAQGLAQHSKFGIHVVGSGCTKVDGFAPGTTDNEIEIDVKATTGADCSNPADCEANLTCHQGPSSNTGYCAKLVCSQDGDCPPGSRCVFDSTTGNLCARPCASVGDCLTYPQTQDCVGRLTPGGGCVNVCVYSEWNKDQSCP
ncbi:MAG: hypothetical protein V1754_05060 [Pseudomonadota bacterium]